MKHTHRLFIITMLLCAFQLSAKAQNELVKQGTDLQVQGKHIDAMAKFAEALKADPQNDYANYQMAYSLYATKKGKDAIPYLYKASKSANAALSVPAYCLLATIYDEGNERKKAIATYKEAIGINPAYPQIYYNVGLVYSRDQQYEEAEKAAIEAIKRSPKNANNQRLYALATFHQNKRVNALMGFCSFLLLAPSGDRAAEAHGNIKHIMQGGVLTDANGKTATNVSIKADKETATLNSIISIAVLSAKSKKLTGADMLQFELKTIFTAAGQLAENKTDKTFFDQYYAAYFYKLAKTEHIPAFVHIVMLTDNNTDNAKWAKENPQQATALSEWLQHTERGF